MIKKILDAPKPCFSSEHNIPSHMVFQPGTYEHICPSCGKKTIFTVPQITCMTPCREKSIWNERNECNNGVTLYNNWYK